LENTDKCVVRAALLPIKASECYRSSALAKKKRPSHFSWKGLPLLYDSRYNSPQ